MVGAERLREIMAALVDRAAVLVQRSEGTVGECTSDGIMAVLGGRPSDKSLPEPAPNPTTRQKPTT